MGFQPGNDLGRLTGGKPRPRKNDQPFIAPETGPVLVVPFVRMTGNNQLLHLEARHSARGLIRDPDAYHSTCHGSAVADHVHSVAELEAAEMAEVDSKPSAAVAHKITQGSREGQREVPSRPIRDVPAAVFQEPKRSNSPVPTEAQKRSARSADIRWADVDSLGGFRICDEQDFMPDWGE